MPALCPLLARNRRSAHGDRATASSRKPDVRLGMVVIFHTNVLSGRLVPNASGMHSIPGISDGETVRCGAQSPSTMMHESAPTAFDKVIRIWGKPRILDFVAHIASP